VELVRDVHPAQFVGFCGVVWFFQLGCVGRVDVENEVLCVVHGVGVVGEVGGPGLSHYVREVGGVGLLHGDSLLAVQSVTRLEVEFGLLLGL
jgi:hypothetical protein